MMQTMGSMVMKRMKKEKRPGYQTDNKHKDIRLGGRSNVHRVASYAPSFSITFSFSCNSFSFSFSFSSTASANFSAADVESTVGSSSLLSSALVSSALVSSALCSSVWGFGAAPEAFIACASSKLTLNSPASDGKQRSM